MSPTYKKKWNQPGPNIELKKITIDAELNMEHIAEAIKKVRTAKKISQKHLGELVGVSRVQITKIENAQKDARISTVVKVFKALDIPVNFKVEYEDYVSKINNYR